jgi:hypothetical protein
MNRRVIHGQLPKRTGRRSADAASQLALLAKWLAARGERSVLGRAPKIRGKSVAKSFVSAEILGAVPKTRLLPRLPDSEPEVPEGQWRKRVSGMTVGGEGE